MDCNCPKAETLTDIDDFDCPVDLKQIQRLAFQRDGKFETLVDLQTLAEWQAFKAATDDTKMVITPVIGGDPVIEPGEAITNGGGDNSTLNGRIEYDGVNPSTFTAVFKSLPATIEKQLKALNCEMGLKVFMLLQGGRVASKADFSGFDVENIFVSDRGNQGFATKDTNSFSMTLAAGWSEDLIITKPNFNPITEL